MSTDAGGNDRPERKIDYVELPSPDLEATKQFFTTLFGWTFEDYGPEYCAFNDGRLDGGFYKSDKAATVENGSVLVVFYSKDLEKSVEDVKAAGGEICREIFSFPGGRRFHFTDPNGNEHAIWSDA